MKTLQLNIEEHLYDTLLAMLKGLPKQDIEIIESALKTSSETQKPFDINQFSGTIDWPIDGLNYQQAVRAEWDKEWAG